jgi:hypothetical protein
MNAKLWKQRKSYVIDSLFQSSLYVITTGCLEKKSRIILLVYFYEQNVVTRGRESLS